MPQTVVAQSLEHQTKIRRILDIAPLPVIGQRLLDDLSNEGTTIPHLASIIEMDPGLTARLIGLANSAYFALPNPVYTVEETITRVLGLNMVRSIALGIVLNAPFDTRRCRPFQLNRYWFVAMSTAWLARALAPRMKETPVLSGDFAYLSGMMHNFGLIVLASAFPDEMTEVFTRSASNSDVTVASIENEVLGINHHLAAGVLARRWHLPPAVVAVVENHSDPTYQGMHHEMCTLIGLCSRQAHALFSKTGFDYPVEALERLGLDEGRYATTRDQLADKVEEIETLAGQMTG